MGKFVVKETEKSVHFNLVASNGEVIGSSQNYSTKDGCLNGIESVRKNAEAAKLEDQTAPNFETETNPKFEIYTAKGNAAQASRWHAVKLIVGTCGSRGVARTCL